MAAGIGGADGESQVVRPPKTSPPADARRPPEPLRPEPARRPGLTLLATRVRRRRYRSSPG